ncbi:MAG: Pyruvate/ketoisovalerate oxidoreductases common subunit gamma [Methanomassiliicoccales archaeon PtaB.Bin215]|nr:MAG: Pyruvate/ketoisovalerate oxidoreductases common subunit gamma [Methanomassiliicoccales archaeon PtaB.Bin215]
MRGDAVSTIEIRWHGRGGQGVVTANEILAGAALKEGKFIKAFPEFGPERMGAPIRAFARISDEPIMVHSQVYFPDVVLIIDATLLKAGKVVEGLKEGGAVIANFPDDKSKLIQAVGRSENVYAVNATKIAIEEIGRPMTNTAMLGALVKVTNVVSIDTIIEEMRNKMSGKLSKDVVEKNLRAIKRAYEEVQ